MAIDDFPGLPPFPQDVPTIDLPHISFSKLSAGDDAEIDRLFQTCKHWGFFFLDLRGSAQGSDLLNLADETLEIARKLFELTSEEKNKYSVTKGNFEGYKGEGTTVIDGEGAKDRFEAYGLSKDHIVGLKDVPSPTLIQESMPSLRSFTKTAHSVVTTLLDQLDGSLDLPRGTLSNLHQLRKPASTSLRVMEYPPQPAINRSTSMGSHTDFGTITLLFNKLGGLQILPPQENAIWSYVRPIPGHAIINLGDTIVKLTRGLFRSNIHRVTYAPGAQAGHSRFSLAYLVRPDDTTIMKGLEGSKVIPKAKEGELEENISINEWVCRRTEAMKTHKYDKKVWKQTRGTEDQSMRHGEPRNMEMTSQRVALVK